MSIGPGATSKLDLGQGPCRKQKVIIAAWVKTKSKPQVLAEKKTEHMAKRWQKTTTVTICEDCYLLHCYQCKVDNLATYKWDYEYPAQERATTKTFVAGASSRKLWPSED